MSAQGLEMGISAQGGCLRCVCHVLVQAVGWDVTSRGISPTAELLLVARCPDGVVCIGDSRLSPARSSPRPPPVSWAPRAPLHPSFPCCAQAQTPTHVLHRFLTAPQASAALCTNSSPWLLHSGGHVGKKIFISIRKNSRFSLIPAALTVPYIYTLTSEGPLGYIVASGTSSNRRRTRKTQ